MIIGNLIIRKSISILLITTLILSGFFITPNTAHALMVEKTVTKYHLDIGAQHIWGSGESVDTATWDHPKGGSIDTSTQTIIFPQNVSNVQVYTYLTNSSKFKWGSDGYTFNSNSYLGGKDDFNTYYLKNVSNSIYNIQSSSNGNKVSFSYSATLASNVDFDIKEELNRGQLSFILEVLGGEESVKATQPTVYDRLVAGSKGQLADNVYGFMYFTPVIIQYDVKEMVEVGAIDADLNLPSTAKTGDNYDVLDNSYVEDVLSLEDAVLEKKIDGGSWQTVTIWEGTGRKGKNTGGSITEKSDDICDITYRITITASDGQMDTAEKTISITDGREISGVADLVLDKYTYEGHPADADDWSTFEVDGVSYSAKRAYEEKVASNKFSTTGGTVKKDGLTAAIVTYLKRGTYPVTLNITTATGGKLSDTETIEVRKTPYVIDNLGGFQKQNRKQTLTFNVATYPDKPIVDYDITIKDLKSNEVISLTKDAPQENGAVIKTRTVKSEVQDQYWTTLTVEFLTKYPRYDLTGEAKQKFSYKIKVTDSKGDSDEAYKEFEVAPDVPPIPAISIQDSFLREAGTNTASIEAADASQSDGDQLQRTWSVANHSPLTGLAAGQNNPLATIPANSFTNATSLDGYENLAFGTNQTIGWNKEGVGKTTVKLHVKDIWIEPTLEEYINPSDYLEAETTASTQVINIAPVVSIEPLDTLRANIAILVSANKLETIRNQTNSLNAALIENGIDGKIQIVPVAESNEQSETTETTYANKIGSFESEKVGSGGGLFTSDSSRQYMTECINTDPSNPQVKIVAYNKFGNIIWSFLLPKASGSAKLSVDNQEKYLIYSYNDATNSSNSYAYILDSKTGALLKAIEEWGVSGTLFISSDGKRFFDFSQSGIKKYNTKSGISKIIRSGEIWCPNLYEGKIGFIGKSLDAQYYIGFFDMDTEQITAKQAPLLDYETKTLETGMSWIQPVDWSSDGKILVVRRHYSSYYGASGGEAWLLDTVTKKQGRIHSPVGDDKGWECFMIKDNYGNCNYVGLSFGSAGTSMKYNDWYIFEHNNDKLIEIAHLDSGKVGSNYCANMGFYDSTSNKIYIFESGYYGKTACFNLNNKSWENGFSSTIGLDPLRGTIHQYDGRIVTYYNGSYINGGAYSGYYYGVQYNTPLTVDEAVYNSLLRNAAFTTGAENYVFSMGLGSNFNKAKDYINSQGTNIIEMEANTGLSEIVNKIGEGANAKYVLSLIGNGVNNLASIYKSVELEPNTTYQYSYDLNVVSGSAVDVFKQNKNTITEQGATYYKEVVYKADLTNGNNSYINNGFIKFEAGNFFNSGHYQDYSGYGGGATGKNDACVYGPTISFTMQKNGYLDIVFFRSGDTGCNLYIDGNHVQSESEFIDKKHVLIFLSKGSHTVSYHPEKAYNTTSLFKSIEIGYLSNEDNNDSTVLLKTSSEGTQTVEGTFTSGKIPAYTIQQTTSLNTFNIYEMINKGCMTIDTNGMNGGISIGVDGRSATSSYGGYIGNNGKVTTKMKVEITAPSDKVLWISYGGCSKIIEPSQKITLTYSQVQYDNRNTTFITNFYAMEIPLGTMGISSSSSLSFGKITPFLKNYSFKENGYFYKINIDPNNIATVSKCKTGYDSPLTTLSLTTANSGNILLNALISNFTLTSQQKSQNLTLQELGYKFNTELAIQKDNWIKYVLGSGLAEMKLAEPQKKEEDMPLVYKKGQLIAYNINYSDYENDASKSGYWLYAHTTYNDGKQENAAIIYDEDGNIKSVCGQEITAGAITIDEAISIAKSKGLKTLTAPIDRFYVDGKYTVFHWQYDDTSRGIVASGYPAYDKASNTAELTFYVQGGASAPWITGISTSPSKVTENNYFSINIGIDDAEKDVLNLTTEVYKDRKLIYTHRKKNIEPFDDKGRAVEHGGYVRDSQGMIQNPDTGQYEFLNKYKFVDDRLMAKTGDVVRGYNIDTGKIENIPIYEEAIPIGYPVTNTGALPDKAQAGTYEVVATVRDQTGAGLGTYKFIVVSEGKITGYVNHTDKWDENRKKYNLSWFDEEINKAYSYTDYLALSEPRKRGTNVFWSGEKFMLRAAVAGSPTKVTCSINGTSYSTTMNSTGTKNAEGETIYTGSIWNEDMINKWGVKEPEQLTFTFTANYSGGIVKTHKATVIVDNMDPYWRLHRAF